jgi:hypothetical protein
MTVDTSVSRMPSRYSTIRPRTRARSRAGVAAHSPASKLRRADSIACSIWGTDVVSTSAIVSSVAGFSTSSVGPSPGTNLPSRYGSRAATRSGVMTRTLPDPDTSVNFQDG